MEGYTTREYMTAAFDGSIANVQRSDLVPTTTHVAPKSDDFRNSQLGRRNVSSDVRNSPYSSPVGVLSGLRPTITRARPGRVRETHDSPLSRDTYSVENFALSPDTRKLLEAAGHKLGSPQPANHLAALLIGAPSLEGKPVGRNRFYGANDPRRNSGLAMGY